MKVAHWRSEAGFESSTGTMKTWLLGQVPSTDDVDGATEARTIVGRRSATCGKSVGGSATTHAYPTSALSRPAIAMTLRPQRPRPAWGARSSCLDVRAPAPIDPIIFTQVAACPKRAVARPESGDAIARPH